jgi:hypothetical protein
MTGGKALPADINPQSAPGSAGNSGDSSDSGSSGDVSRADGLGTGLPRPFFADQPADVPQSFGPGQPGVPGPPYGQPTFGGPRYGWPGQAPGQAAGQAPGQAPAQNGYGQQGNQQGNQPGGWPPFGRAPQRQQPPRQASQGGASQRPMRPPERELRQRAIASLVFGAIGLVALLGLGTDLHKGVYLLIFSAAVGLSGCIIGISAVMKARRTSTYRPRGAVGGIVLGALATLISVPILAVYLIFPTQVNSYVNCLSQAQNSSDQSACMSKFYKSIHLGASASPNAVPTVVVRHR